MDTDNSGFVELRELAALKGVGVGLAEHLKGVSDGMVSVDHLEELVQRMQHDKV
jgi:hypothetical protein